MANINYNTANTISVNYSPGENVLTPATSSNSLFTFGDFSLQEPDTGFGVVNLTGKTFSKINIDNLNSLTNGMFDYAAIYTASTNTRLLNLTVEDPVSYAYFSSFYTKIAQAINNITANFPYAILSQNLSLGNNISNISYNMFDNITNFTIEESSLINQGNVVYKLGATNNYSLFNDYTNFSIQLSGAGESSVYPISYYTYSSLTQQLYFSVIGNVFSGISPTLNFPIYIRPSSQRLGQFKKTISPLEYQLLYNGQFLVPSPDVDATVLSSYTWSKSIDGFNPDSYGIDFDSFTNSILTDSQRVDEVKTNIFLRTVIPDNFIDLDSDDQIYQRLVQVYGDEFDKMKQYIDGIAYAHSIEYTRKNSVPNIFMQRLASLLGANLRNTFTDVDFFKYIAGEAEGTGSSYQDFNYELWTRILVNLNFLYKRKGTRDAIMFIFKILGAPDCLINFNEFVYKVTQKKYDGTDFSIDPDGYPSIINNPNIFQSGGVGRGNGQDYINFYHNSFDPKKTVDNIKVYTGQTSISSTTESNTRDTINTKEVDIFLDPAQLIECDVKNWYSLGYGYWNWGSTGSCVSPYSAVTFSGINTPFDWSVDANTCMIMNPPNVSAMTINQYMDYLYASFVNPRNRKVYPNYDFNSFVYLNLRDIYLNYMYWGGGQESNRLTFKEIDRLLEVIERGVNVLGQQFIPATTITHGPATLYRNTLFNRQKFVYKPGINDGSEFKKALPPEFNPVLPSNQIIVNVNDIIHPNLPTTNIQTKVNDVISSQISSNGINSNYIAPTSSVVSTNNININIPPVYQMDGVMSRQPKTDIIPFPIQ